VPPLIPHDATGLRPPHHALAAGHGICGRGLLLDHTAGRSIKGEFAATRVRRSPSSPEREAPRLASAPEPPRTASKCPSAYPKLLQGAGGVRFERRCVILTSERPQKAVLPLAEPHGSTATPPYLQGRWGCAAERARRVGHAAAAAPTKPSRGASPQPPRRTAQGPSRPLPRTPAWRIGSRLRTCPGSCIETRGGSRRCWRSGAAPANCERSRATSSMRPVGMTATIQSTASTALPLLSRFLPGYLWASASLYFMASAASNALKAWNALPAAFLHKPASRNLRARSAPYVASISRPSRYFWGSRQGFSSSITGLMRHI